MVSGEGPVEQNSSFFNQVVYELLWFVRGIRYKNLLLYDELPIPKQVIRSLPAFDVYAFEQFIDALEAVHRLNECFKAL